MLSRMSVTAAKQAGRTFSTTSQVRAVYLFRTQEIYLYIANFPYIRYASFIRYTRLRNHYRIAKRRAYRISLQLHFFLWMRRFFCSYYDVYKEDMILILFFSSFFFHVIFSSRTILKLLCAVPAAALASHWVCCWNRAHLLPNWACTISCTHPELLPICRTSTHQPKLRASMGQKTWKRHWKVNKSSLFMLCAIYQCITVSAVAVVWLGYVILTIVTVRRA